jgi:D-alanyl-D-alanine carboxypeptidase/D-alanyl-D-alanine-endopeptidase (penicillin-binding protein 4)
MFTYIESPSLRLLTPSLAIAGMLLSGQAFAKKEPLEIALKSMAQKGGLSAQIVNLTQNRELLKVNPDQPLNPASSIKLFTAYTALSRLGINYQFKTRIQKSADGSLCVKGGGDPSFVMEDMYLVVESLKRKGLQSYSGKITLDPSAFDEEFYPEDRSDQDSERAYNAPISGLNFNYNTITAFVSSTEKGKPARFGLDFPFDFVRIEGRVMTGTSTDVTWDKKGKGELEVVTLGGKIAEGTDDWRKPFRVRTPSKAFGEALSKMLETGGVVPEKKASFVEGVCPVEGAVLYEHQSKPLSFIVGLMNKYSNNFIADSLVKALDHEVNRRSGTAAGGLAYIRTEMEKIGIDASKKGRVMVSGSGLSLDNRMSASDFVKLLKHIHKEKVYLPEMFSSLPIAGMDGTLRRKYKDSAVANLLRGKTGSLSGVQSLVGVYPNKSGEWIGVSIIVNGGRSIPEAELGRFLDSN